MTTIITRKVLAGQPVSEKDFERARLQKAKAEHKQSGSFNPRPITIASWKVE